MKRLVLAGAIGMLACSLSAADSGLKEEVLKAAKKLGENSYSWKSTVDSGQFNFTSEGKYAKDGTLMLSSTFNDVTNESFKKGDKVAVKTDEGWKSGSELESSGGGGQFNRGAFAARSMANLKPPAVQVEGLLKVTKELKPSDGAYVGELTTEGVKPLLTFGFRRPGGQQAPEPKEAKGSVKFWIKNGALVKYETHVQGKIIGRDDQEREIDRTTTVEIKEVGTTKITVPEEAQKKLS